MQEFDFSAAKPDKKAVQRIIEQFSFTPAVEQTNIKIPILTPPVPTDVPGSEPEPVYDAAAQDDIQGNIIPGFNKDHQHFLFFRIDKPKPCKAFLKWLVPYLSSMEEVLAFRRLFRSVRFKVGEGVPLLSATLVNIAFSYRGISLLVNKAEANSFGDQSFKQGLAERSSFLGDPTIKSHKGHPSKWVIGDPDKEADIIIIVASDTPSMLDEMVNLVNKKAKEAGLGLLFQQRGETLPDTLRGHEHFGFKDGVSQPGIRGKLSASAGNYITPRYIANTDPRRLYFAKPGQLLAWPGQFLLGELRQNTEHLYRSAPEATNFPRWAKRGSYLVVRRLNQDVNAFWSFVSFIATKVGMSSEKVAAMLVGRWPSGAPIMRERNGDNPALGEDTFANNHFIYDDDTRPSDLQSIAGYAGDTFPPAMADFLATVCPHFAHIRKVNPRDSVTDLGKPEDNLSRMFLRRGIPFGPPVIGVKNPSKALLEKERGLMFLSYSSSIEDHFEFVQQRWSNSPVQPNLGGADPIIGQNGGSADRVRMIDFPTATGVVRIKFKEEWITPTGGGYFFAPTISAINTVLAE